MIALEEKQAEVEADLGNTSFCFLCPEETEV